jgi:hypothetical protein
MRYETPEVDVIGTASDLIQNFAGPRTDGDGFEFSQGAICSNIEEE